MYLNVPTMYHNLSTMQHKTYDVPPYIRNVPTMYHNVPTMYHNLPTMQHKTYNVPPCIQNVATTYHNIPQHTTMDPHWTHNTPQCFHNGPTIHHNGPTMDPQYTTTIFRGQRGKILFPWEVGCRCSVLPPHLPPHLPAFVYDPYRDVNRKNAIMLFKITKLKNRKNKSSF